eukprot:11209357-Lingulodinium_polyedra.AAC.1
MRNWTAQNNRRVVGVAFNLRGRQHVETHSKQKTGPLCKRGRPAGRPQTTGTEGGRRRAQPTTLPRGGIHANSGQPLGGAFNGPAKTGADPSPHEPARKTCCQTHRLGRGRR